MANLLKADFSDASAAALSAVNLTISASLARITASLAATASARALSEAIFAVTASAFNLAISAAAVSAFESATDLAVAESAEALATASESAFSAASLAAVCAASSDTRSRTVISANGANARAGRPTTSAVVASPAVVGMNVISERVPVAGSVEQTLQLQNLKV